MRELPSGTVTFLFTNIEGSTALWERYPAAMRMATARHDVLLSSAIQDHHGSLYKHVGDAVQAAFCTPADALASAVTAQRALTDEPWSGTGPLRVRMALHIGEAAPDALYGAGWFSHFAGKEALAEAYGEEALALARQAADPLRAAMALALIGGLAHDRGDLALARRHYEEAVAHARESGQTHFIAMFVHDLAGVATDQGDHPGAAALLDEALSLWRARGDSWAIGNALKNLGKAARVVGDIPHGAATYREAVTLFAEHGDRGQVAACLEGLAHLATVGGEPELAARLFGAAEALYETTGVQLPIFDPNAYEPTMAAMRAAVDEATIAAAWAAGRALPLERAVVEAKDVADALAGGQS